MKAKPNGDGSCNRFLMVSDSLVVKGEKAGPYFIALEWLTLYVAWDVNYLYIKTCQCNEHAGICNQDNAGNADGPQHMPYDNDGSASEVSTKARNSNLIKTDSIKISVHA